jgi:RNA polymerase sigma-70 factor (ECF subfamily)
VLQDVWLQAFRGIAKLKDPASVRSWLYSLTRGAAVDRIRKDRARDKAEEIHIESFDETAEPDFTADDAAAVHQALDSIEMKHREVLVLHFLEDFSLQEAAQILNCPEGTVKSRIHYAKKALKTALLEKKS